MLAWLKNVFNTSGWFYWAHLKGNLATKLNTLLAYVEIKLKYGDEASNQTYKLAPTKLVKNTHKRSVTSWFHSGLHVEHNLVYMEAKPLIFKNNTKRWTLDGKNSQSEPKASWFRAGGNQLDLS